MHAKGSDAAVARGAADAGTGGDVGGSKYLTLLAQHPLSVSKQAARGRGSATKGPAATGCGGSPVAAPGGRLCTPTGKLAPAGSILDAMPAADQAPMEGATPPHGNRRGGVPQARTPASGLAKSVAHLPAGTAPAASPSVLRRSSPAPVVAFGRTIHRNTPARRSLTASGDAIRGLAGPASPGRASPSPSPQQQPPAGSASRGRPPSPRVLAATIGAGLRTPIRGAGGSSLLTGAAAHQQQPSPANRRALVRQSESSGLAHAASAASGSRCGRSPSHAGAAGGSATAARVGGASLPAFKARELGSKPAAGPAAPASTLLHAGSPVDRSRPPVAGAAARLPGISPATRRIVGAQLPAMAATRAGHEASRMPAGEWVPGILSTPPSGAAAGSAAAQQQPQQLQHRTPRVPALRFSLSPAALISPLPASSPFSCASSTSYSDVNFSPMPPAEEVSV